jgi:signal transduction histidine kinase
MAQLVQAALKDFAAAVENAGLKLSAEITPDAPPVRGDSTALRRMLDNLFSNALKFTPKGGRLTVRLFQEPQALVLTVADTGIGIPGDKLGRIFERFYQVNGSTTRQYGGVGLGLALVKEIVEAHNGTVTVASQVGAGTTFTVSLPD